MKIKRLLALLLLTPISVLAAVPHTTLQVTSRPLALFALLLFGLAYVLVMTEELTHLRKSKPVVIAAGVIWLIVAAIAKQMGQNELATLSIEHNILEYSELFMFLLVAMTYVNALEDRKVFDALRAWLLKRGLNYQQLFWVTGFIAFFLSPIADNLTTALLMCAVVMALGKNNKTFVSIACVNIVVAANAGGAYSPFGDITTLMIWSMGKVEAHEFLAIFIPSLLSFIVPATVMSMKVPKTKPRPIDKPVKMRKGAHWLIALALTTIITTLVFHTFFHLPPMVGMMTGLGYLNFFSYYVQRKEKAIIKDIKSESFDKLLESPETDAPFDIFNKIKRAEWDTLFFFYGVIMCVGGLATLGYLELTTSALYNGLGMNLPPNFHATPANILVGIASAIFDNIPVVFAVLTMNPAMSHGQWLLVTLTAGIGGSLLSIGSAAGVALMGQARGNYTFMSHLKWTPVIFLGYVAAVVSHLLINQAYF